MTDREIALKGGRVTAGVVRVADTVRRPLGAHSPFVHAVLRHLEARGLEGVPRFLGVDAKGREILTFLPGDVPTELGNFSDLQLAAAARLLRRFHDASADCELKGECEIICHGDPGPCNSVFVDELPVGMIDFDAMRPGFRREDVGYATWLWLSMGDERFAPELQGQRLAAFAEAYGAIDLGDVLPALRAIQNEFSARPDVPANVREWAGRCRTWLTRHLNAVTAGYP
jgi:Ser/Thr protein kinase RdoA (MazF antagonist)